MESRRPKKKKKKTQESNQQHPSTCALLDPRYPTPTALMQPITVPDLDDRMMRSAGRWSPLDARTTSPTDTLNYPAGGGGSEGRGDGNGKIAQNQTRGRETQKQMFNLYRRRKQHPAPCFVLKNHFKNAKPINNKKHTDCTDGKTVIQYSQWTKP